MPMPIWIRSPPVLQSKHERLFRSISSHFLREKKPSRRTRKKGTAATARLPNVCQQTPLLHHSRLSLPSVRLHCKRNLQRTMLLDMIGSSRKVENLEKCQANTNGLLI